MKDIHSWWKGMPHERFWLGVTGADGDSVVLATPRGTERSAAHRTLPLITHIGAGDVLFHYDDAQRAIVAWSVPSGPARKRDLDWLKGGRVSECEDATIQRLPSWVVPLDAPTPLETPVSLEQIADVQSEMFPALRDFEDRVGEPLYYPFAIGSPSATRMLEGYLFKLPALFVTGFPVLAQVARAMSWFGSPRVHSIQPAAAHPEFEGSATERGNGRANGRAAAFFMR